MLNAVKAQKYDSIPILYHLNSMKLKKRGLVSPSREDFTRSLLSSFPATPKP